MTEQYDVVIVGGGLAGYTAAATVAESGANVLILEKTSRTAGNVVVSGASFVFSGTEMQRAAGIDDSPEQLRADLLEVGGGFSDPDLVDAFVDEQLDSYHWMQDVGIVFKSLSLSSNQSRPRSHSVNVLEAFSALAQHVESLPNVTILVDHPVKSLITDAEGRVIGVNADTASGAREIHARKGVLLATGGFNWSKRAIRSFAPKFLDAIPLGNPATVGDGLYMAMSLGADLADMGFLSGTFGTTARFPGMPDEPRLLICMYRGAIIVNSSGHRYIDESKSYKVIATQSLSQDQALGFQVFDQQVMQQSNPEKSVNDYAGALESGYLLSANTLRELAVKMNVDADAFEETVRKYNEAIASGVDDEFGRVSLAAGYGDLTPLTEAPFYSYPSTIGLPSTYGGVRVDHSMNVLTVTGAPIEGLFAAGEIVGGFHGKGYISGTSLSKSVIFARIAGRALAEQSDRSGVQPTHA